MTGADLAADVLAGDERALARAITVVENREPGYRDLVDALHRAGGDAAVVGVTGSPGAGKSTLVDHLARSYCEAGLDVGVIAVDPASPYSGGSVLGDRIRMGRAAEAGAFVRSMSARGHLGGLSPATGDAVTAMSAAGFDVVLVETVGTGQNELEVVGTADSVVVLVPPESGDDVQMLKAGLLEVGDVFVVNKADLPGADRTVAELRAMLERREAVAWEPPVVETVATDGEGVADLRTVLEDHAEHLRSSGELAARERERYASAIRTHVRDDLGALVEAEIDRRGGMDALVEPVLARERSPYDVVADLLTGLEPGENG